jgi:signal transduction histidine kinase
VTATATTATTATATGSAAGTGAPGRRPRDRFVDVVFVVLALLIAAMSAIDAHDAGTISPSRLGWSTLLALVGCVALWWRRRWPIGVALLLVPAAALTEFVGGAVLVAIFTVAAYRPWRPAVGIAVLHLLVGAGYYAVAPVDPSLTPAEADVLGLSLIAAVLGWGMMRRSRRELLASLRERATRAEAEAGLRADRQRGLERERIAREMHDVLAHRISLVSLHAGALETRTDLSAAEVARVAGTIRASAHQALEDLREILGVLRADGGGADRADAVGADPALRPQPGLADLDTLVAECRSTGTAVEVQNRLADAGSVPASVSRTAYRVVQEGLTNVRKHAPGAAARLTLDRSPTGEIHLWLRNPLVTGHAATPGARAGRPAIPGAHAGLVGLAERVTLAGGRLDGGARRTADGTVEFHLEAWLPWPT